MERLLAASYKQIYMNEIAESIRSVSNHVSSLDRIDKQAFSSLAFLFSYPELRFFRLCSRMDQT